MSNKRILGTNWVLDELVEKFNVELPMSVGETVKSAFLMEIDNMRESCKAAFKAGEEGKDFDFGQYFKEIY